MKVFYYLLLATTSPPFIESLSTVVYGTPRELQLLIGKICSRNSIDTALICSEQTQKSNRVLMYGRDYGDADIDDDDKVKLVSSGEDIDKALKQADSLVFVNHESAIEPKAIDTLVSSTVEDKLKKIILLSKQGVTKAKGGFFGGGDEKLLETEKYVCQLCKKKKLDVSIIRAGTLKGGGPGREGNDFGLDKSYYATLIESLEASVTMAYDKFTLGAYFSKGDEIKQTSPILRLGMKSSFEGAPDETSRIIAAEAVVSILLAENVNGIEFSVGSEKSEVPPTREEWEAIIEQMR